MGVTMRHMFKRELRRVSNGHYKKSAQEELWTFFLVLTFAALIGFAFWGSNSVSYYIANWTSFGLLTFSFPVIIYVILKLSLLMRWFVYWIIVATGILLFVDSDHRVEWSKWMFVGFICVEAITIFVYIYIRSVYPKLVLILSQRYHNFWDIQPHIKQDQYTRRALFVWGKRYKFSYTGSMNEQNLPHGYGKWTSEWRLGESLSGYWENGIPIGPFDSREYRTGYAFSNVRIGFATSCAGPFTVTSFKRAPELLFGVGCVECSVSGRFFSDLPKARVILDPFKDRNYDVDTVVKEIIHPDDFPESKTASAKRNTLIIDNTDQGLYLRGYVPENDAAYEKVVIERTENEDFDYSWQIKGWKLSPKPKEAIVFVPGFNCSMEAAFRLFGQMITLGTIPSYLKPFVFGWPGGNLVGVRKAVRVAQSQQVTDDFIKFIQELTRAGFTKIHLICHSMGARVVNAACKDFYRVFRLIPRDRRSSSTLSQVHHLPVLSSITYINPEALLNPFCEEYVDIIRSHTSLITIYGNNRDIALKTAEALEGFSPILGCNVNGIRRSAFGGGDIENYSETIRYLMEVDVIDTTELDMNIHLARHSYFNLNKFIVDDVFDLIITRNRAKDREHRLLNIRGNVYGFLSAPSYVVT
ncbi:hypothetical protein HDV04_006247 [Boothiomyces sp. JEL0838]|nr:hypothetical protein HDV04_006247 [Boothiomyces sp. JEL0838]